MNKKIKAYIFDLDGTIAFTLKDLNTAMNQMLEELKFPLMTEQDILNNINCGARQFVTKCLPKSEQDNADTVELAFLRYREHYNKCYLDTTVPYPNVKEGLEYIKSRGIKLAVFSNKSSEQTIPIAEKLFPKGTFDIIMGHDGRFEHKPNPDGALYIANHLEISPKDIGFVGDSDVDMHTAINAGMHLFGVSWGYRSPELLTSLGAEKILYTLDDIKSLADYEYKDQK